MKVNNLKSGVLVTKSHNCMMHPSWSCDAKYIEVGLVVLCLKLLQMYNCIH